MIKINENYLKLQASYLFSEIRKRTDEFQKTHPDKEVIKLGYAAPAASLYRGVSPCRG